MPDAISRQQESIASSHTQATGPPAPFPPQMREQRATVEGLVDAVVEGYHAGFNKSIHNYSQILRLFAEARMQVGAGTLAGRRGPL